MGAMGSPERRKRGYAGGLAGGLIAAGGTLGILIPPSITFILYGIVSEQSIGKLFIAGIIPGILLATLFAVWVGYKSRRDDRQAALALRSEEHTSELQSLMRISYAVFCLKKKIPQKINTINIIRQIHIHNNRTNP